MKKHAIIFTTLLGMTATATLFTGCNRPTAREATVNSKIASKLFAMEDLAEVTGKEAAVYVQGGKKDLKISADAKLSQTKLEGSATEKIFKKVIKDETKAALADQLKTGSVAIVVLDDQIKIMKVVADTSNSVDTQLSSLSYMAKMKQLVKANANAQAALVSELEVLKYKSPAELGEKFGLVEITALKIEKHGVLDNEKTDYNEAKSILNVVAKPFELSTHIIVGDEISSGSEEASAKSKTETEE
ncbi:MAG: hypothetical protein ABL930_02710 [Pseudobdellovibrio sp.]